MIKPPPAHTFIDIPKSKRDANVYRILSFDRFLELIESKENVLAHPSKWDDPFENFFLNATYEDSEGQQYSLGFRHHIFGQCWTFKRESDAMWRIYSPHKDGVRIRSTARKLLTGLSNSQRISSNISCFIGKVSYYPFNKLQKLNLPVLDSTGHTQARSLLIKRPEFIHEQELRLIYLQPEVTPSTPIRQIFRYPVNPNEMVDQITFDPRMSKRMFDVCRLYLKSIKFPAKVSHSRLYRAPTNLIRKLA